MKLMIKGIFGGLMIAAACSVYLQVGGVIGAFLFGAGLWVILNMQFKLFTGTVGYIKSKEDVKDNAIILLGNLIGACGVLALPAGSVATAVAAKLALPIGAAFIRAIICGVFIYFAVHQFKNKDNLSVFLGVAIFILCGAEHCIADACYLIAAHSFSLDSVIFFIVAAIGNSIGALVVDRLIKI